MLADSLTKGGIDRFLHHAVSNDCKHETKHESLFHSTVSSATKFPVDPDIGFEHRTMLPESVVGVQHRIDLPDSVAVGDLEGIV